MSEREKELQVALEVLLDQMDFTGPPGNRACSPTEMIGACVPEQTIQRARKALDMPEGI